MSVCRPWALPWKPLLYGSSESQEVKKTRWNGPGKLANMRQMPCGHGLEEDKVKVVLGQEKFEHTCRLREEVMKTELEMRGEGM